MPRAFTQAAGLTYSWTYKDVGYIRKCMSTKTVTETSCDGPGCDTRNTGEEHIVAKGWLAMQNSTGDAFDFCGVGCVRTWADSTLEDRRKR